jgi:hypothetical protein
MDARVAPISMEAQADASSIHSATTAKNARWHLDVHEPASLAAINPFDPEAPPK